MTSHNTEVLGCCVRSFWCGIKKRCFMSNELLEKIYAELADFKSRLDIQEKFISILMVMIPKEKRGALAALTRAYQLNVAALEEDGQHMAEGMQLFKDYTDAHGETPEAAVFLLLTQALLVLNAPADRQEAMKVWLSIASEGEVAHDATQLFGALLRQPPASGADDASGDN